MFNTILEPLFVKYEYYFICHWRTVIPLKGFALTDIYELTSSYNSLNSECDNADEAIMHIKPGKTMYLDVSCC